MVRDKKLLDRACNEELLNASFYVGLSGGLCVGMGCA